MKNERESFEVVILKKCGWSEDQLKFLGSMVFNIEGVKGNPIMDVVSMRLASEVVVECFVPNSDGERMAFTYSSATGEIDPKKSSSDLVSRDDVNVFLQMIETTINGKKGTFLPSVKIKEEHKNSVKPM